MRTSRLRGSLVGSFLAGGSNMRSQNDSLPNPREGEAAQAAELNTYSTTEDCPQLITARQATTGHYVYAHTSPDGQIFYIGKGTARRAWSIDRDALWYHYVRTRCGGRYGVQIVADGLDESVALELEDMLIGQLGSNLVNWVNRGRQFDYAALDRYHTSRDATRAFVSETRALESSDPELAIERYREALERGHEYSVIEYETGLVADLRRELGPTYYVDTAPLDRLTMLLRRLKRFDELVEAVDDFCCRYPRRINAGHTIFKRRDEALAKLAGKTVP